MEIRFSNGYVLALMYLPGRVKPVLVLSRDGRYVTHAVVKDSVGYEELKRFFESIWPG